MKRRGSLDVLKIFATVFIIFHHYQQVLEVYYPTGVNFFSGSFPWEHMVELFFMISGFVMLPWCRRITGNVTGSDFKSFILHRYRRFIPMLAVTAVCYELMSAVIIRFLPALTDEFIRLSVWGTVCNILCIQSGWCVRNVMINNPTWYICVLMLCYIVFWIITDLCRRKNRSPVYAYLFMIILGFSVRMTGMNIPFLNEYTARGFISFFLGILLAAADDRYELHGAFRTVFYVLFALLVLFTPDIEKDYSLCYLFLPLIILIFTSERVEKLFTARFWTTLGAIQFHAYLWHLIVIECMRVIILLTDAAVEKRVYMFITLIAAELVGTLSYFLLDKNADRLFIAILPKRKANAQKA